MTNKSYKKVFFILALIYPCFCQADLSVNTQYWPKQLPEEEYNESNYYGNGTSSSFYRAMTSTSSDITPEEENSISAMLPESEKDRWYMKVGMYKVTTKLNSISNKSENTTVQAWALNKKKISKDITGMQIGAGYIFDSWRLDVDYIFGNTINYDQPALFTTGNPNITSKVTGQHLIGNAYYEFNKIFLFKPFVGISAGLGMNKVASNFSAAPIPLDNGSKSKTTLGFDYGLQFGARINLYKRFYASASYKYISMGSVKWTDPSGNLLLKGTRLFNGFTLDLMYLL